MRHSRIRHHAQDKNKRVKKVMTNSPVVKAVKSAPIAQQAILSQAIENEERMKIRWLESWGPLFVSDKPKSQISQLIAQGMPIPSPASITIPQVDLDRSAIASENFRRLHKMEPHKKYERPVLTSQELGWRQSIELFGVCQHGIRRNADLQSALQSPFRQPDKSWKKDGGNSDEE